MKNIILIIFFLDKQVRLYGDYDTLMPNSDTLITLTKCQGKKRRKRRGEIERKTNKQKSVFKFVGNFIYWFNLIISLIQNTSSFTNISGVTLENAGAFDLRLILLLLSILISIILSITIQQ